VAKRGSQEVEKIAGGRKEQDAIHATRSGSTPVATGITRRHSAKAVFGRISSNARQLP
jgi:hypothetical protein